MKHLISRRYILRVLTVLLTISLGAFVVTRFSAAASAVLFGSQTAQKGAITARAENLDEPWIKLQPSRSVGANYRDATERKDGAAQIESATRSLDGARTLSLASNDFNADGFPDLICGYATSSGGLVSIQRGNPASYAPEDPAVLRGIGRQEFPDPFFPDAGYVELPERPDFLGTVDFNRDGQMDIVAATRGSDGMYLLAGDGHGGFAPPQRIALPGVITAMTTGKIDQADGTTSVILGLDVSGGSALMIYEGTRSLLETTPAVHSLPAEPTSLAVGRLDDDQFDDVGIVAGGQVFILHGHGQSDSDHIFEDRMAGKIEALNLPFAVQGMGVGTFIWSRDGAQQMALLGDDGAVHIAAHGQLDTRPFTAAEVFQKRQALEETRAEMEVASREGRAFMVTESERPAPKSWSVVEDLATPAAKSFAATAAGSDSAQSLASPILLSTRISTLPSDDLLIMNPAAGEFQISYNESSRPGVAQADLASPQRSAVELDAGSEPVAVLPMRVSVDGRPGLVVMTKDSSAPHIIFPMATVTYHVTGLPDNTVACSPVVANASLCSSLREAIIESNANAGADTIVFDLNGTFTLSITSAGGNENAAATRDLDVNDSLTITGNGSANTIISTSYNSTCGDCKVFGVNQTGGFNNLTISFTGMTIQNGVNNGTCGSFFDTGGGVDFFLTGTTVAGNSYSITNSVIKNNQIVANCAESHGGGLNVDSTGQAIIGGNNIGTVTLTGDTFQGNSATHEGGGLTLAADKHDVTMSNCTVGGPLVANGNQSGGTAGVGGGIWTRHSFGGTVTINGGSFQNNKASSTPLNANGSGGAITISGNQVTNIGVTSGVTFTDNSALESGGGTAASDGGAINIANLGAAGVTGGTQISNSTISNNHADNGTSAQGGGIYFNAKYSATISNCTISSNTSGRGAGVFNGGSGGPQTLTIDTGSIISSNAATGSGGGVANIDSLAAT